MSALVAALLALQAPLDAGTLVIRHDTTEVARESFELSATRTGPGGGGWVLTATTRYEGRPPVTLAPTLVVTADSAPGSLAFPVDDPREPWRILAQASRNRFTVRTLGRHSERAREYSLLGPTVVLDDSVFSLYVFLAWYARSDRSLTVTALLPRREGREILTVEDLGSSATTLNRDPATLHHVVVTGGAGGVVHLWLDARGRLMKLEIPSRDLRVERLPPA